MCANYNNKNQLCSFFQVGDEIVLGSMVSEGSDWQWGELHGQRGMFPANFVEML